MKTISGSLNNSDRLAKSLLANEIERFWKKIRDEHSVKIANCLRALPRVWRKASLRAAI